MIVRNVHPRRRSRTAICRSCRREQTWKRLVGDVRRAGRLAGACDDCGGVGTVSRQRKNIGRGVQR